MERGLANEGLNFDNLEDPGEKFTLEEITGTGVNSKVYTAIDKSSERKVAIKVQKITNENMSSIEDEYKILRDLSDHCNLPDFYGAFKKTEGNKHYIWFVMELCEGGPIVDLIHALERQAKKMNEIHIAFILREVIKALLKLHENHVIHRDVKGSNILLTKNGEVKLVDFGLSRELSSSLGRCQTSIGSPSWMAPEVVDCKGNKSAYDNRADVWALGITAIELGDGNAPYQEMNPSRALFQIVRNPPPTLYRPANWSQNFNDFIAECLEKNPENRPYLIELLEHPFLQELPENDFHINAELRTLLENVTSEDISNRISEISIRKGYLKKGPSCDEEPMRIEDLSALEKINEDNIIEQLEARYRKDGCYTFIGDVLLFLNPNKALDIYGFQFYCKYKFKSRSDNEPHIFSIADGAYQDMLHHDTPQHIIISGETMSGKTQQYSHVINHLLFLGMCGNQVGEKVKKSVDLIQAFGNASTPLNNNSTRHATYTQITYSKSGKLSGAIFWLYQLEKWRVTGNRSPYHANFHIFYYLYDGLCSEGILENYMLEREKNYFYLRRDISQEDIDPKVPKGPRDKPETNAANYRKIKENLTALQFQEAEQNLIWNILSAILLLGEVEYKEDDDGNAEIKELEYVNKVAQLMEIDSKRLAWALCNYCVIEKDTAARRKHSIPEAIAARNVLAQTFYARLVDWIINNINYKLSVLRAVCGDHHYIGILDMFGFECYEDNGLEQLFANTLNEQLQYYYIQKIFISEMEEEEEEEDLPLKKFHFYNNKDTMDEIFNKPYGIMHILDEANKLNMDSEYIIDSLDKKSEGSRITSCGEEEFSLAHYTGKIRYHTATMCTKNRDFLPPELTEILRCSVNNNIKQLFTNKLNRTGNLTINTDNIVQCANVIKKKRWGSAILADQSRTSRPYNTASKGEFSQTRGIRTAAAIFKSTSLELLRAIATGSTHFVRCIRTDLNATPGGFQQGIVRQQLRALSVVDTAKARQSGYSQRITFAQFLERYQFLAFDFDEEVDKTMDNCRLLMLRLKLEGWHLGKSKVFLKYYHEEYLSRMYETQVKKIIKVQSMLRAFLAKRNVANKKIKSTPSLSETANQVSAMTTDEAAVIIQKNIRGYVARKTYGPLINVTSGRLDEETTHFIKRYFNKWKAKSIFQVLILYRASKYKEFIYFCQQVHLYNQNAVSNLRKINQDVPINTIDTSVEKDLFIGEETPTVWKIPFRIKDYQFCESSHLLETVAVPMGNDEDAAWDEPFTTLDKGCQTNFTSNGELFSESKKKNENFSNFISTPYSRDPKTAEMNYKEQAYRYIEDEDNINNEEDPSNVVSDLISPITGSVSEPLENKCLIPETNEVKYSPVMTKKGSRIIIDNEENKSDSIEQTMSHEEYQSPYRERLKKNELKINPISELELKGRQIQRNDPDNDDEPPFNFQAMLRKTNHSRTSLKRGSNHQSQTPNHIPTSSNGSVTPKKSPVLQSKTLVSGNGQPNKFKDDKYIPPQLPRKSNDDSLSNDNNNFSPHYVNTKSSANQNVTFDSKNGLAYDCKDLQNNNTPTKASSVPKSTKKIKSLIRNDSLDSITMMIGVTNELAKGNETDELDKQNITQENKKLVRTEIIPGLIILGGPVTDL